MTMPRRRRRGYPQAILIGLEENKATTWNIYSESIRLGRKIEGIRGYSFYESLIDALRPALKEGIKSILIATTDDKEYEGFMNHVKRHQRWLLNGWSLNTVTFEHIKSPAMNITQVRELVSRPGFNKRINDTFSEGIQQVMNLLDKKLNDPKGIETLYFSLKEVEQVIDDEKLVVEYILLTEHFRDKHRRRSQRLLQLAKNRNIKTRIIQDKTAAGTRITQLGGLVCMTRK